MEVVVFVGGELLLLPLLVLVVCTEAWSRATYIHTHIHKHQYQTILGPCERQNNKKRNVHTQRTHSVSGHHLSVGNTEYETPNPTELPFSLSTNACAHLLELILLLQR